MKTLAKVKPEFYAKGRPQLQSFNICDGKTIKVKIKIYYRIRFKSDSETKE